VLTEKGDEEEWERVNYDFTEKETEIVGLTALLILANVHYCITAVYSSIVKLVYIITPLAS